jgi:uncharacterized protein YecT (DUF1311 family)
MKKYLLLFFALSVVGYSYPARSISNMDAGANELESYLKSDKELNVIYNRALEKIRANGMLSDQLRDEWIKQQEIAQRAWVEFRDKDAKVVEYDWFGGSGMGAAKSAYLRQLTEERISNLRARYELK